MKKYIVFAVIALSAVLYNGCEFDTLPLNVPISVPVNLSGSQTSLSETENFCLTQYESYTQYLDDMRQVTFLEAAFRIDSVSNPNLTGNIKVELRTSAGALVFSKELNNVKPADYMVTPYIFSMTGDQIQLINQYISNMTNTCFSATVSVTNISGGSAPYYVGGVIDMVFEAETEL